MLTDVVDKPSQMLHLIDQIQRLGIDYHFERDIDEQLEQIHKSYSRLDHGDFRGDDLHMVALIFRLLRQQGYNISSEVFNKFKDSEGNFKESLVSDVRGLLSLYEACHLRCHGDSILEEALPFAITHLESVNESKVSTSLVKQVSHALEQPLRKGLPRLEARCYIPLYQEEPSHDEVLLALAKLDFNLLQEQHQKELGNVTSLSKRGGHLVSAVELLMKEHGISEQEAEKEIQKRVIDAWKDTNEEFLRPTAVPTPILTQSLNLSRAMDALYSDGDNYTHSGTKLKGYVTSLFVSPLPM
ncbi:hypothetical protein NL676_030809 [Syzygium grande]|nr:hypothetical protein NL676_030809 [Syzygium grande]